MSSLCVLSGHGMGANNEPMQREAEVGALCLWHRGKLTAVVVAVRELWVDLAFIDQAGSAPKDETPKTRHLKSAEAPAPANLEVLALRDNRSKTQQTALDQSTPIPPVMEMVASWVLLVAEERPLTAPLLPTSTVGQLQLLQRHGDWIAGREWVGDFLDEMTDLRKALSAALRDQPYRRIGSCQLPVSGQDRLCGGALMKENGSDVVKCSDCKAAWVTRQERARLALSLEEAG